jgi:hypothetical protein
METDAEHGAWDDRKNMNFHWQKMTFDEFAETERSQGVKVVKVNDVYWRQVRACLYRPFLPYLEYSLGSVKPPATAWLGGYQHAVPANTSANSYLNLLIFENTKDYVFDTLQRDHRREVRQAGKQYVVRRVEDPAEFKEKAYKAYLSFYGRTHYQYKSERQDRECFGRWADSLFRFPKVVVLGAYREGTELQAVSISKLVEDTMVYSTVFGSTESLKCHVTALLLHTVREALAAREDVKQFYIGMYNFQGRTGVHGFYIYRGCRLVIKPAHLHLNPVTEQLLKRFMPKQYEKLYGGVEDLEKLLAESDKGKTGGGGSPGG